MDRTSWIGVTVCAILFIVWSWYTSTVYPKKVPNSPLATNSSNTATLTQDPSTISSLTPGKSSAPQPVSPSTPEQTVVLENEFVQVTFSSIGGAIKQVNLLKHLGKTKSESVILHEHSTLPFLARTGWVDGTEIYSLDKQGDKVIARAILPTGLIIERIYSIQKQYQIELQECFRNPNNQPIVLPNFNLSIGSGEPVHTHDQATHLKSGWMLRDSDSYKSKALAEMQGGFFSQPKSHIASEVSNINWVATTNQFFASIVKLPTDFKSIEMISSKLELPKTPEKSSTIAGIYSTVSFQGFTLAPQTEMKGSYEIYTGPKEYEILKNLSDFRDHVMDFSIWGWVIRPLLWIMHHIHRPLSHFGNPLELNYGWVIVLLTVFLKLCFWPLQSTANASMKKMQALAPKMEELKKKHEKNPQKMNEEVMKLYRDYGVNPVGGCLPMLVQFPIFLGLYTMLQSAVEVRNESFFWIKDLAQPDTIYTITQFGMGLHIDVNPLPLIMTATSIVLMKMTPQTTDNPQMKMLQWMPVLFLYMLYNFAAALSLYWTVNNLLSMLQTYRNLKTPPPKLQRIKKKLPFGIGKLSSS